MFKKKFLSLPLNNKQRVTITTIDNYYLFFYITLLLTKI